MILFALQIEHQARLKEEAKLNQIRLDNARKAEEHQARARATAQLQKTQQQVSQSSSHESAMSISEKQHLELAKLLRMTQMSQQPSVGHAAVVAPSAPAAAPPTALRIKMESALHARDNLAAATAVHRDDEKMYSTIQRQSNSCQNACTMEPCKRAIFEEVLGGVRNNTLEQVL
jgi:crotonobetainyl-CoA:carnitine CoA-transferase CaiB-like acyl-CoA transferase